MWATRVHVLAAHIGRQFEALFQAPSYSGALDVCYAEARARGQAVAGSAALPSLERMNKRRNRCSFCVIRSPRYVNSGEGCAGA